MKKTIAVVGSCVSRDIFNSRFTNNYRDEFTVTDTIYQSALPSFTRESEALIYAQERLRPSGNFFVRDEPLANRIGAVAVKQPDFVLIDFFSDIHFGVSKVNGNYVTRNHMVFEDQDAANNFFLDKVATATERMRFGTNEQYRDLAISSIISFRNTLSKVSPRTKILLNSARFATKYLDSAAGETNFYNSKRLEAKNRYWSELDDLFLDLVEPAEHITHDETDLVGTVDHEWGLHPVHYIRPYYTKLWDRLMRLRSND